MRLILTRVRCSRSLHSEESGADNDLNIDEPHLLGICQTPCRRADTAARCLGLALLVMKTVHSMAYKPIGDICGVKLVPAVQLLKWNPVKLTAIGL